MKNTAFFRTCMSVCFILNEVISCGQLPGFSPLEHLNWTESSWAFEHWTAVDAFATSFASPLGRQMHIRVDGVWANPYRNIRGLWGHSIPWGEQHGLVLFGGASRIEYPGNDLAAWHVIWRMEGRVVAESNAWHPFLEWSSPLRSSDNQSGSNLRFGGLFVREFERGEMQFFWQWMEPAWTFEVKVFLQCHEAIHVGFSGQWQPRIWGLNCRVFIGGFAAHVGLAPVPLGGWRARWAYSKEGVN